MTPERRAELLNASALGREVLFSEDEPRDAHGRWTKEGMDKGFDDYGHWSDRPSTAMPKLGKAAAGISKGAMAASQKAIDLAKKGKADRATMMGAHTEAAQQHRAAHEWYAARIGAKIGKNDELGRAHLTMAQYHEKQAG